MTIRSVGLGIEMGSYHVNAEVTASIRAAVRAILVREATTGSFRNRTLAATLLRDALWPPHGYFGQTVGADELNQWHADQMELLEAFDQVMAASSDPHVRLELRSALEWHAEHSTWTDAATRARAIGAAVLSEGEEIVRALREPIDWLDQLASEARLLALAEELTHSAATANELAWRLNAEIGAIDSLPWQGPRCGSSANRVGSS